jgi:hypothetical protein
MMEAVRTSETSVNFNANISRYIPEGCKLHTRRRESLKSHNFWCSVTTAMICDAYRTMRKTWMAHCSVSQAAAAQDVM